MMMKITLSVLLLLFCSLCGAHSLGESADAQGSSSSQQSEAAGEGERRSVDSCWQLYINLRDEVRELRETVSALRSQMVEQKRKGETMQY